MLQTSAQAALRVEKSDGTAKYKRTITNVCVCVCVCVNRNTRLTLELIAGDEVSTVRKGDGDTNH